MKIASEFQLANLSSDPLTIQLCDNDEIPFKVIVKCESQNLSLQTMQRPITKQDGLLFQLMSTNNYKILYKEILDYKAQLRKELETQNDKGEADPMKNFEATCKIFLGTQYLGNPDQKRKLIARDYFNQTQQMASATNNQDASAHLSQSQNISQPSASVSQPSAIATNRNPNLRLVNNDSILISKQKQCLICAIYENESIEEIKTFVRSFYNQKVDIVILCNGQKNLNQKLRELLFFDHQKEAFVQKELEQNKFSVNNALVLQYVDQEANFPRVIFMIKYFQSSYYDLQKWAYAGIGKFFDPNYFYMTKCSYLGVENSIQEQIQIVNKKDLCGVTSNVLTISSTSVNPIDPINAFLLNKAINQLESRPINKLFSISMDHDPFFCFYKWQKTKYIIPSYLAQISKSEKDFIQNIIVQDVNFILPNIAAEKGLFFAKNDQIMAKTKQTNDLAKVMEEQRRKNNSYYYSNLVFWKFYKNGKWKMNGCFQFIQTIILLIRALLIYLDSYFGISAIIFIISQSSYQFFGGAVQFEKEFMLQMIIPAIFIFSLVIFILFTLLFSSVYQITSRNFKPKIEIKGTLVFYFTQFKKSNTCTIYFENELNHEIRQGKILLQSSEINFKGAILNASVLSLSIQYQNARFVALREQTQQILNEIKEDHRASLQPSINQIKKDTTEYFYRGSFDNLVFYYENDQTDAAPQYSRLFYLLAIQNVILFGMFITNFTISFFQVFEDFYIQLNCVCFIIIVAQKLILILLNPSHIPTFFKGYLSYVFYYLVVTFGMRFYEMGNTDNNFESTKLKEFYYNKVENIGSWIICNVVFLFVCFMIEAYYNFCGYVLLAFLFYFAIGSLFSILGILLSKLFLTSKSKSLDTDNTQESSINAPTPDHQLNEDDFILDSEQRLEEKFLVVQEQANQAYYDLQIQQTNFLKVQLEQSKLFQTKQIQQTQKIQKSQYPMLQSKHFQVLPTIQEEKLINNQNEISLQNSDISMAKSNNFQKVSEQQLMQSNYSQNNNQSKLQQREVIPKQSPQEQDDEYNSEEDGMLQSKNQLG